MIKPEDGFIEFQFERDVIDPLVNQAAKDLGWFASADGPEVDILTAARTGFISQGLAIFVLENIRQSRDFIAHGGALRETLRHYLDA